MNRKKLTKLIPLGITLVLLIITNFHFITNRVLIASFGFILVLISLLLKKDYWKYLFALFLILSCTRFIQFFYKYIYIRIGFITIELFSLALLILHLFLNKDIIRVAKDTIRVASQRLEPSQESRTREKELKETQFEKTVSRFEGKFSVKKRDELEIIVSENRLIPEAVEAAKRLLNNNK